MRPIGIDEFLWRAGDVNPLIDRVDTAKIRGLTSPARRTQPPSNRPETEVTGPLQRAAESGVSFAERKTTMRNQLP